MTTYRLVDHLATAARRGDASVLGVLRRGARDPVQLYPIVARFLPEPPSKRAEDVSLLVAGLFPLAPALGSVPLAEALARKGGSNLRFSALLSSSFASLDRPLRWAVASVAAPIDWHRLFGDLLAWDAQGRPVQRGWARQYFAFRTPDEGDES